MSNNYPHLFSPIRIGKMALTSRLMMAPHTGFIGADMGSFAPFGSEEAAERNLAYLLARARSGVSWLTTITGLIANTFPPGFEPTGLGAMTSSSFHLPYFEKRVRRIVDALHAQNAYMGMQLLMQAGTPHQPTVAQSSLITNVAAHVLDKDEIAWLIAEFKFSARRASDAGVDVLELHVNHDDIMQQFISPLTNRRNDEYGGDGDKRLTFVLRVLEEVKSVVRPDVTVGIRFTIEENVVGGYGLDEAASIARRLGRTGMIEYIHAVMGSPWGNPSYIQPVIYGPAPWALSIASIKEAAGLPILYSGRVNSVEVAEEVLSRGVIDMVGMARGLLADPDLLAKARRGDARTICPCIGCNDCIHRPLVDGLMFACAVNPFVGHESEDPLSSVHIPRKLLVIGGGPAGLELAALASQRGLGVELWEREEHLGGQMRVAARAPGHEPFNDYLDYQERRLSKLGVTVRVQMAGTVETVLAQKADVIAVATGARSRSPGIDGLAWPGVHDIRAVLQNKATIGSRVAIIVQDDYLAPLSLAMFLVERRHQVVMIYQSPSIAPQVGKYSLGGFLGKLCHANVEFRLMEQVISVKEGEIRARNVYSQKESQLGNFDSIVLACGGESESWLYDQLKSRGTKELHLLGDAFAPRRISFATQQAYALARLL